MKHLPVPFVCLLIAVLTSVGCSPLSLRSYSSIELEVAEYSSLKGASKSEDDYRSALDGGDADALKARKIALTRDEDNRELFGTNFGIGPAMLFNVDRVESAEVQGTGDAARVVTTNGNGNEAALLLEFHHFFEVCWNQEPVEGIGVGPFAALSLDTTNALIGGLGLGLMVGMKIDDDVSFNVGYGRMIVNDVERLPDGVVAGEAPPAGVPPAGVTTITPVKSDETVNFLLVSFRWSL